MSVNVGAFQWTARSERAALLVAQDEQTDVQIAKACKISDRTLDRWKLHPEFAARVREHRDRWREEITARGIAERQNRVDAQNDRWRRMQMVVEARAEEHKDVPGGASGLLVRTVKLVKVYDAGRAPDAQADDGDNDRVEEELEGQPHGGALRRRRRTRTDVLESLQRSVEVDEYAVDTGLLKEFRELEKLAAQENGQWTERHLVTPDVKRLHQEAQELADELGIPVEQVLREAGIDARGAP
jgi:hypothetical protein